MRRWRGRCLKFNPYGALDDAAALNFNASMGRGLARCLEVQRPMKY